MYELPLFPLNMVLFPGTPIHLHIFEARYIQMVNSCVEENLPFGVALIRSGVEAHGPLAEPHYIGCTAQIAKIQPLTDGRMNLVAVGEKRFRLLTLDRETKPYLVGRIQPYPLENADAESINLRARRLRQQFQRFLQLLIESGRQLIDLALLPDDDVALAYLAAAALPISPLQKQELLASDHADRLLENLARYYQRELALLEMALSKKVGLQAGGFSTN